VLLLWLLCTIAGTLAPFDFAAGAASADGRHLLQYGAHQFGPDDLLINLLLFVPFGALLHHDWRHRTWKLRSIVMMISAGAILISGTIEYAQSFLPTRDSSIIDVLFNTLGALLGVTADRRWGTGIARGLYRLRARTSFAILAGLTACFLMFAVLVSGALQRRSLLSNWNPEYPLLIGNEQTGDRPWQGRVFALTITDAAMPVASVRRFAAGQPFVAPGTRVAAYDLSGIPPYSDAPGVLPRVDSSEGRFWLQTKGPASGLVRALAKSNAFTIYVRCATDDVAQKGPARIVSNSVSTLRRNFTLGQEGSDLVVRLRTPATGRNGYPLELHVPRVFADRSVHDVVVTYDGSMLSVAMAGVDQISRMQLTPGATLAMADPTVKPGYLEMFDLVYAAMFSLVPGILLGLLGRTSNDRRLIGLGWVVGFSILLELTEIAVSGRPFAWEGVLLTALVSSLVCAVLSATFSEVDLLATRASRGHAWWPIPTQ